MTNWIELMGFGARGVLVILFLLSIWSVSIMIDRRRYFKNEIGDVHVEEVKKLILTRNWAAVQTWSQGKTTYVAGVVNAALNCESKESESVDRAVQSYLSEQRLKLEKGLNVLATLGSNAPFIGLFGTVMGIIQCLGILSLQQGSSTSAMMLGLGEALIATAVGLFVAIPAVVAYNYFSQKLRNVTLEAQSIRDLYVSKLEK